MGYALGAMPAQRVRVACPPPPRRRPRPLLGLNPPDVNININTEPSTEDKIRAWMDRESFFPGVANKWLVLGGIVLFVLGKK